MTPPDLQRWNERFGAPEYLFGTEPNAFLVQQQARLVPGMRVLCVADGEGRNGTWLASLGMNVTAFDFSPVGLKKAAELATKRGVAVDFRRSDVNDWDWRADSYDAVVAIFVQFATPEQRVRLFDGMVRTLRPGGVLILQGYRPEQIAYGTGGPPQVEHLYTEELLRSSFGALEILHLAAHDSVVREGPGHDGLSALIDLVGRKPMA